MKLKSIIAGTLLSATLLATTASATGVSETSTLFVNGNDTGAKLYVEENTIMLPLRALCEHLGFEVIWQEEAKRIELVKMPIYITCTPFEDGYTFSRTAPMMLGTAPKLINDRTYVPLNFIDEILKGSYESREDDIYVSYGEETKLNAVSIIEIKDNTITVEDEKRGEIVLNVTEETIFEDEVGNALKFEDITVDSNILVQYDEAMTLSLPAIANAVKIVKVNEVKPELKEVLFVEKNENGEKKLTVFDFEIGNVVLNITDETVIEDEEGNAVKFEEITNENKLLVEYGPAMTMSLPPITNAVKIVKTKEIANELIAGKVEELIFEEEKLTQIIISDKDNNLTALNIGEETYVLNQDGEEGDLTKLEKGDEISGIVSAMSTRSIPPQKAAYKLRISK